MTGVWKELLLHLGGVSRPTVGRNSVLLSQLIIFLLYTCSIYVGIWYAFVASSLYEPLRRGQCPSSCNDQSGSAITCRYQEASLKSLMASMYLDDAMRIYAFLQRLNCNFSRLSLSCFEFAFLCM